MGDLSKGRCLTGAGAVAATPSFNVSPSRAAQHRSLGGPPLSRGRSGSDCSSSSVSDRLPALEALRVRGYTLGMKTAVSIPDEVFEKAERLARRARRSRSELFSAALSEYVARHAPDEVTEAMNRVCEQVGHQQDAFVAAAGRRVLEKAEW